MLKNAAIAVLLIIAAAVGSATTVAQAQSDSDSEIEVRITAQRLADGRTEFALQQRDGDGWSDRIAPRSRFLPAEPPLDRWLVSTPVTIVAPGMLQTESGGGVEVRITAQRLEDGRTEFALQQRDGDGWSDRIAPRSRFLPAEPPLDRWLVSTPVTIADSDSATVATVGAGVEGVLEYAGDSDYFRFTAEEGQLYQIDVALGTLSDSSLELRGSDDGRLEYNDDHGDSLASRIVWEAPASGDYYLVVGGFGEGSYTLTVSHSTIVDDHGNDSDSATVATVGADVEGVLEYADDSDYFRFTAEEGQLYQIDVALGTLSDSYLELRGSDGWRLEYNDDHGDSLASRIVWEAPASGDYYLVVGGFGEGSYTLTVSHSTIVDDHGNDSDSATVATVGAGVEGVLEYADDSDYFRFTAEEGQLYQIDVALGTLSDSYLELRGSDDGWLEYNDDHGDSLASRIVWEAPASGDYYLVVGGFGEGSYTLTVSHSTIVDDHGNDSDSATVATVGADVEGVLEYADDSDYFRFTAEEGQLYQIDVALGTLSDSYLELRGSDGWRLEYNDDHGDSLASRIVWEAPASGDYYLVVGGFGEGSYTLTVSHSTIVDDHGNDSDSATVATVGADVEGVLEYAGDSDYFRFTAEEGQLYQIDVALGTLSDSYLELRGSDGWRLEYNDDHGDSLASRIFWEAPASGDYYLVVGGFGEGSYTLTIATR